MCSGSFEPPRPDRRLLHVSVEPHVGGCPRGSHTGRPLVESLSFVGLDSPATSRDWEPTLRNASALVPSHAWAGDDEDTEQRTVPVTSHEAADEHDNGPGTASTPARPMDDVDGATVRVAVPPVTLNGAGTGTVIGPTSTTWPGTEIVTGTAIAARTANASDWVYGVTTGASGCVTVPRVYVTVTGSGIRTLTFPVPALIDEVSASRVSPSDIGTDLKVILSV
jgi:hypothetical protein